MDNYLIFSSLIFYIGNLIKLRNPNATLSHVLLETYSRLLAENNIPGIRNVVGNVSDDIAELYICMESATSDTPEI